MDNDGFYFSRLMLGLRNRQKDLGLTDSYCAKVLGMRESNYVRLINGKFGLSVYQLLRVCNLLNVNLCIYPEEDLENETS